MKHPKRVAAITAGTLVLVVGGCTAAVVAGSGNSITPSSSPSAAAPASPAQAVVHPTPPGPSAVPATPAMTITEQQAVDSARGYLSDGQGFSEAGLFQQLTSSDGEGDTAADAQFAISYLHPDWYQQAVASAKGYLADGEGFSKASLYDQLTSSAGEGFTPEQANYALSQVGM
jgi:hypothetical protein